MAIQLQYRVCESIPFSSEILSSAVIPNAEHSVARLNLQTI